MGSLYRSKPPFHFAFVVFVFIEACSQGTPVTMRTVTLHAPGDCAVGVAIDGSGYATYSALGDFDAPVPSSPGHLIGHVGEALEIGDNCRTLVVDATENDRLWLGVGAVPAGGDIEVLVLPSLTSCALVSAVGPRPGAAAAIAPFGDGAWGAAGDGAGGRVLVVGGQPVNDGGAAPPTLVARLDTGRIDSVSPDLLTPRTRSTVTAFGGGALVAGGFGVAQGGAALSTAEVYVETLGGFDQQHPILLGEPRADHGAIILVTGETLLVAGVGGDATTVLDSMEIVDPSTRTVRAVNVARLSAPRRAPTVLRLVSGEILVAGGLDAASNPVAVVEWFSPDASVATKRASSLVTGKARAFAALAGGGALAVIAPPDGAPPNFQNVWVISPDGAFTPAIPIAGAVTRPVLFGGAGGAPALWTGDRWLRWQPWGGAFGALGVLDGTPAQVGDATTSPDPGLAMWLDPAQSAMTALRFDTRGAYSPLRSPLLVSGPEEMAPAGLLSLGAGAFDPSVGLTLSPGESAFVTDRSYADVSADVDIPTGEGALLVLRDQRGREIEVGGATCPVPLSAAPPSSIGVQRRGQNVTWTLTPAGAGTCPQGFAVGARLAIGLRCAPTASRCVARNLRVSRLAAP